MGARQHGKMSDAADAPSPVCQSELGLVCMTTTDEVRFRTITLKSYSALPEDARAPRLAELYADNLARLLRGLEFCARERIRLFRMSAHLFPLADYADGVGWAVLQGLRADLARVGQRARALGIRLLIHPEQFIVLNSERPEVAATSARVLAFHADVLDLMDLPASAWAPIILHAGKRGRMPELVQAIAALPANARARLALENDEVSVGAQDVLGVCRAAGVPMVFDAHHHVVKEKLPDQEDASVRAFTLEARATWPDPAWQIVHLSSGIEGPHDRRHADLISVYPSAYLDVPWVEVEAKGKETAIRDLRARAPFVGR
ncbi:UV-endonuclease UvdE [Deinococcus maricopensis DSM 21211]|uniref:UV-endonuclease UvdE n=2 Tax=Deinococcus TaxID=1298 RepID=E8U7R7_DEIML|nr:UV-endonuclease UvdE [Deinococcus maricopensis DSM 21211]